jgi:hypothetical protein
MTDEMETICKEVVAFGGTQENNKNWLGQSVSWLEFES